MDLAPGWHTPARTDQHATGRRDREIDKNPFSTNVSASFGHKDYASQAHGRSADRETLILRAAHFNPRRRHRAPPQSGSSLWTSYADRRRGRALHGVCVRRGFTEPVATGSLPCLAAKG